MLLREAKEILKKNGYRLSKNNEEINEGVMTIAAGIVLGKIALAAIGVVTGIGAAALYTMGEARFRKIIEKNKVEIGEEIKTMLMEDEELAAEIANKTITKEAIKRYIGKALAGSLGAHKEFKNKTLDKVSSRYNRSVYSLGNRDVDFEWEMDGKLAEITYDAIMQMNESLKLSERNITVLMKQ